MKKKISNMESKSHHAINQILWNNWDPLGINDAAPIDEYQSYVPELYTMLMSNKTSKEISERLFKIETEIMGLTGCEKHCRKIANMLIEKIKP